METNYSENYHFGTTINVQCPDNNQLGILIPQLTVLDTVENTFEHV